MLPEVGHQRPQACDHRPQHLGGGLVNQLLMLIDELRPVGKSIVVRQGEHLIQKNVYVIPVEPVLDRDGEESVLKHVGAKPSLRQQKMRVKEVLRFGAKREPGAAFGLRLAL